MQASYWPGILLRIPVQILRCWGAESCCTPYLPLLISLLGALPPLISSSSPLCAHNFLVSFCFLLNVHGNLQDLVMQNLENSDKKLSLLVEPKLKIALEEYVHKGEAQVSSLTKRVLARWEPRVETG